MNDELNCIVIGDLFGENGYGSEGGRIHDIDGICPTLGASHFQQVKYVLVIYE